MNRSGLLPCFAKHRRQAGLIHGKADMERAKAVPKKKKLPAVFIAVCVIPGVTLVTLFILIPAVWAMFLSLTDSNILQINGNFIGLENFRDMFQESNFLQALANTFKLLAVIPIITIFCAFILAFLIQQSDLREKNFYISVYFMPSLIAATIVAIVFSFVFHPTSGILNRFLELVGLGNLKHAWLGEAETALWCVGATIIWSAVGYYMVMHLAGMDSISPEIYEAATMDGATFWTKFNHITLPMMKDILGITYVLAISNTLGSSYVLTSLMTNGGPNGTSNVILRYIYEQGISSGNMGYASAVTVFTLTIVIGLALLSRKMTESKEGSWE